MIVLETITSSKLYGFAHNSSDTDYYRVTLGRGKNGQVIKDGVDTTTVTFPSFCQHVAKGVPQAMEALYSPKKWVHPDYAMLFKGMHPDAYEMVKTYRRTIRHFVLEDTDKHRRHAMRLAVNLADWWGTGSFNPVMPADLVSELTEYAKSETLTVAFVNDVSPVTVWDK